MEDPPRSRFLSRCPISQEIDGNEITNERSSTAAALFCRLVFRTIGDAEQLHPAQKP